MDNDSITTLWSKGAWKMIKTQNENDLLELTLNMYRELSNFSPTHIVDTLQEGIGNAVERVRAERGLVCGGMDV